MSNAIVQCRRGTAAEWTANNYILAYGQIGFELDGNRIKVGNGVSGWNNLNYIGTTGSSASGISSLNGLTSVTQTFAVGASGSDFSIVSTGSAHTFYIPNVTANSRGLLTSGDFLLFSGKLNNSLTQGQIFIGDGGNHPSGILVSGDGVINTTGALVLATVNSNIGSFTYATVTVDAKGRITAVSSGANPLLTAITSINGTTNAAQTLITGVGGTDFNITSTTGVTTFNIPTADATNRGLLSPTDWSTFNNKLSTAITSINSTTNAAQSLITGMVGSDFSIVSTTGVNVFNIPTANQNARGLLSSGDWITFSGKLASAITSINSTTNSAQSLITGVAGTDFNIVSTTGVNAFNIPSAATGSRGLLTSGDWISFAGKLSPTLATNDIFIGNGNSRASGVRIGGDATLGATGALTLATVNATTGTYSFATITANSKGLVISASSGNISSALDAIGNITGSILYSSGSVWSTLPPGSSGYALVSRGVGFHPVYAFISGSQGGVTGAIISINGIVEGAQLLRTGVAGTDFTITSAGSGHTFNIPSASASNRGLLTSTDWTTFNNKLSTSLTSGYLWIGDASNVASGIPATGLFLGFDEIGGDATISETGNLTLATVNSNVGSFQFATVTVNAKGLTTAVSSGNISSGLDAISNITGVVLYRSGAAWSALPPGSSGYALMSQGANLPPKYALVSGGGGIASLNGLTDTTQTFSTGYTGNDFGISSAGGVHTFNMPTAATGTRGLLSSGDWITFAGKLSPVLAGNDIFIGDGSSRASGVRIGGDATIGSTGALILSTVNLNIGTYPFATVTASAKGLVTSVSSGNISAGLDSISNITGVLLYRSGNAWSALPPGTSGQILSTSGPNTFPSWNTDVGITGGLILLNGLGAGAQLLIAGTGGSDFAISSVGSGHTFNIPTATANIRGVVSSGSFDIFDRSRVRQFGITVDGGGSVPSTGYKGSFRPNYSGQITKVTMLAIAPLDTTGYAIIDIYKDTFGNYRPTIADKITAVTPPTLSGISSEQTTLTGWTTAFSAGDVFGFDLKATGTITKFSLIVDVQIG